MLNLDNLKAIIQSKVDALGPDATEKDLLLLSKAIESAVGNISVSKIAEQGAVALVQIDLARQNSIVDVGAAGDRKIAEIVELDVVRRSGDSMDGPLSAPALEVAGASAMQKWHQTDGGADAKRWDIVAHLGRLAFRAVNDAYDDALTFMEVVRHGIAAAWVTFSAPVRAQIHSLTDSATITPDLAAGQFFTVTLEGNRILGNPAGLADAAGQSGYIIIKQDATGGRSLSFGDAWKWPYGVVPFLSTGGGKVDVLGYRVVGPAEIHGTLIKDIR